MEIEIIAIVEFCLNLLFLLFKLEHAFIVVYNPFITNYNKKVSL